jgi:hypothetical protein
MLALAAGRPDSMRKSQLFIIAAIGLISSTILWSCASDPIGVRIDESLPQSKLADYNDRFDRFRTDLWEKTATVFSDAHLENIRLADLTAEDGQLRIETKTGGFSKGGLATRYKFRGDFDVQIDCHIRFLTGLTNMDQILACGVVEQDQAHSDPQLFPIGLSKRGDRGQAYIFCGYHLNGRFHRGFSEPIKDFHGSLRILRIGTLIQMYYRRTGATAWEKMCSLESTGNDALFGFTLQNFAYDRKSIVARVPITAWVDNFKINAAQQIIESEI